MGACRCCRNLDLGDVFPGGTHTVSEMDYDLKRKLNKGIEGTFAKSLIRGLRPEL